MLCKCNFKTIKKILNSLVKVCLKETSKQINIADFLVVQCDKTSDIPSYCQMGKVFR